MDAGQPELQASGQPALQQLLELGHDLLCLAQQDPVEQALADLNQHILASAARWFDGRATLWLRDEILHGWVSRRGIAPPDFLAPEPLGRLMRCSLETRQTCGAASADHPAAPGLSENAQAAATPLLFRDQSKSVPEFLGILQIERPEGPNLSGSEIQLLEALAAQSALALQAGLHIARERWRRDQLSLVRQVSLQLINLRDLDEIARRITALILETFRYYYVAIFTLEPGQDVLHFRASAGPRRPAAHSTPAANAYSPALAVHLGQGMIGHVAQTGEEVLANDVRREALYRHLDVLPETCSEVALPLMVHDRLLGVLDVQSDQPDDFDETDLLVLRALAGSIATAVEETRLYNALRRRAAQLSAIHEISSAINSILDHEKLLEEVVQVIDTRFSYPSVNMFTVHPGRRKVIYEAGNGAHNLALKAEGLAYDLDNAPGLIPWVARHGETILTNDVDLEPRYEPMPRLAGDARSELAVPLVFGGEVLGVLDIQSDRSNAFSDEDRFLIESLGDQIAIALRNATLYRSENWRRKVAESLREVAGLLSADVDLDQVLDAILTELEHTLPLDVAAIWLVDEENGDGDEPPLLHLAAVHGGSIENLDIEIGLEPEEVLAYNLDGSSQPDTSDASAWLLEAIQSEHPVVRTPQSPFDPLGIALGFPANYSAIAAPLRVGEQPVGLLVLAHRTSGRYGGEARLMTAAFASYAAVAIENARLYEAAHEQAWVSTVLLQVANATQSVTNLNDLLVTVIRIAPMLAGVRACLLYILDEDGDFIPSAAAGLSPEQQAEFERWRFAPGDVAALDRLVEERQPVILSSSAEDWRLATILAQNRSEEHHPGPGLKVLVPLVARGESLGAFVVDYSANLSSTGQSKSLEAFFDERLAILQGIAHQTAVAVDNIRLLKSQKEEAYVSVALLQVAQAVVSSNDLDEALGSIVRITPILVGVKRAAIYLWNDDQTVFHLAEGYGLQRSTERRTFPLGAFPLLDAILLEDSLMALPLNGSEPNDDIHSLWTSLGAPDLEKVEQYLLDEPCLLLAFPLSVKGNVLGALLVEEPDPSFDNAFSSGNANRRLREKRLEIITGISQQAALAIQNEQLQRETVERERLEREMQLAREIQQAFLPHELPELQGWELQTYWRPAREVGGDFFDVFELPGNRLGLVIADVADKGMPAALFMTLVRTLLRATIQTVDSPARALERLNDLIVPDAPSGMFVTIAFALLTLDTGVMLLANAGHNPPIVARQRSGTLQRLVRGGMALGVQDANHIEEQQLTLESGDYLVMYTDGITEAFSAQDDLFGEQRLLDVIHSAMQPEPDNPDRSAAAMLQAIEDRLAAFVGEIPPSDDITLLVVKNQKTA